MEYMVGTLASNSMISHASSIEIVMCLRWEDLTTNEMLLTLPGKSLIIHQHRSS